MKTEPEYPIKGIGRGDLVVFDKSGKPWLVIETKSSLKTNDPLNPKVIDQAMRYANWLGTYYFATCDGRAFVLFDNKEKEISLEAFAEKLLFDIVNLEQGIKKWSPPDEAFVARLKLLHERLVPLFARSIKEGMKKDLKFRKEYKEWLDRQGYKINNETNEKVSIEAIYLLLNKILFYKVLETKYKGLQR